MRSKFKANKFLLLYILPVLLVMLILARPALCAEIDDQLSLDAIEDVQFIDKIDKAKAKDQQFSEIPETVTPDFWAYEAVKHLVEAGLLEDTPGHAFRFNKSVTKQELVKRLKIIYENKELEFDPSEISRFEKYLNDSSPATEYKKPDTITPTVNTRPIITTPLSSGEPLPSPSEILSLKGNRILGDRELQQMPLNVAAQGKVSPPQIPEPGPLTISIPPPVQRPGVMPLSYLLNESSNAAPASRVSAPEGWNLAPSQTQQSSVAVPVPVPAQSVEKLDFKFPTPTPSYTPPPPAPDVYIPFPDPTVGINYNRPAPSSAPWPNSTVSSEKASKLPNKVISGSSPSAGAVSDKKEKIDDNPSPGSIDSSGTENDSDSSEKKSSAKTDKNSKSKTEAKEEKKTESTDKVDKTKDDKTKDKKAKAVKVPKEFEKLAKETELDEKDAEMLAAIVDYVEKDVVKKKVEKTIGEVSKIAQRNEREIEKLQQENSRYKITGSGSLKYETINHLEKAQEKKYEIGMSLNLYSKPRKFDDMILRTTLTSRTDDLVLQYQNYNIDKKNPRNFKLRALSAGKISFGASPLTIFGTEMKGGFYSEMNLNDYSIKLITGKKEGILRDSNLYINAMSLQFNLFNESRSWIYLTRISNTHRSKYDQSDWGQWAEWYKSGSNDKKNLPKDADFKNGVNSIYIRYPMPIKGVYLTADYAHSTYYRKGYKLAFPTSGEIYDVYDATCYASCIAAYGEGASTTDYQEKVCKQNCQTYSDWDNYWDNYDFSMAQAYKGWVEIPEIKDQDDAFALLFDYTSGPLSIFPMGYINLGPGFVSKSLGLPGLDTSTLSLDMIPINLQSLEAWLIRGDVNKSEDNYKVEFLAAKLNETKPMFLDTSAFDGSMSTLIKLNLIARLNNRDKNSVLKVDLAQTKLSYYLTDKITFSGDFMKVTAGIPQTCLDGNYTYVTDDLGNTVDAYIGNGVADCINDEEDLSLSLRFKMRTQKYNIFWRTSKKAEVSIDYKIEDSSLSSKSSVSAVEEAIASLAKQGRKNSMGYNFKYKLTDVSDVEMWFNKEFGRPDISNAHPDAVLKNSVGIKMNMSY